MGVLWGKMWEGLCDVDPTNSFLLLEFLCASVSIWVKID